MKKVKPDPDQDRLFLFPEDQTNLACNLPVKTEGLPKITICIKSYNIF
jgi:hypothetical protein